MINLKYVNLNYFYKALYGLPNVKTRFNLRNLQNKVSVLVQPHVFYLDLIIDIINKTNNIPVPFDSPTTTNTELKKL
jgi:lipopolysaccharide biosynthesis protein